MRKNAQKALSIALSLSMVCSLIAIDGSSYKNIQAAGCLHGRYDGNDVWIFRDHFLGGDLSAFQGHHRKKCPVDFYDQDPGLYKW